jgi:ribosomal protein S18 acetylase RimI-like enzyme
VLVREPDQLGLERTHPQLTLGLRLVELLEPHRHVTADHDRMPARLDHALRTPITGARCSYDPAVSSSLTIRPARVEDAAEMARVIVRCWQETYRGLMPDTVLDDPGFVAARQRFWTAALTDERYRDNRVAVAERDGEMVGIAMSGPPLEAAAAWARQLYVLYVIAADHGTRAGRALLEAVVDPEESAALWVADPNPRAQAFYRKHGFVADGKVQVENGVREVRMVRRARARQRRSDR